MGRSAAILLCVSVAAMVALGLVMLASTSLWATDGTGVEYALVKRQAIWAVVGVLGAVTLAWLDYRLLRKFWIPIFLGACLLLVLCYVPGVQVWRGGAARWISLPILGQFQPSEAAKIAVVVALAAWFAQYQAEAGSRHGD